MGMIVYAAEYNHCIYESEFGVLSLHQSKEGAEKVVEKHRKKELRHWKKIGYNDVPSYQEWRVREIEVLK